MSLLTTKKASTYRLEDFVDKLSLRSITLLLIMVSGENLIEPGRLEKLRKPKSGFGKPTGLRIF